MPPTSSGTVTTRRSATGRSRPSELEPIDAAASHRDVLAAYPPQFLSYLRSVSSGVTLVAYSLFAFQRASLAHSTIPWFQLSIIPFVLSILLYALRLDQGEG